jgi:hypothetical protein
MRFKGRIEVVCETHEGVTRFGFRGQTGTGNPFECYENGSEINRVFATELCINAKKLTPRMADVLLALCLARHSPGRLLELGWVCDDSGRLRLAFLAKLDRFATYAGVAKDGKQREKELQRNLRNTFVSAERQGLLDFDDSGKGRSASLRLDSARIHIEPDVVEQLIVRFRGEMAKAVESAPRRTADHARVEQFARSMTIMLDRIVDGIDPTSGGGKEDAMARLLRRADRWLPMILDALRSPDGRTTLVKLGALLLWGRNPPTAMQVAELLSVLVPDMPASVQELLVGQIEHAKLTATRDLCRQALARLGDSDARELETRVLAASFADLRVCLLCALDPTPLAAALRARPDAPQAGGGRSPA